MSLLARMRERFGRKARHASCPCTKPKAKAKKAKAPKSAKPVKVVAASSTKYEGEPVRWGNWRKLEAGRFVRYGSTQGNTVLSLFAEQDGGRWRWELSPEYAPEKARGGVVATVELAKAAAEKAAGL